LLTTHIVLLTEVTNEFALRTCGQYICSYVGFPITQKIIQNEQRPNNHSVNHQSKQETLQL